MAQLARVLPELPAIAPLLARGAVPARRPAVAAGMPELAVRVDAAAQPVDRLVGYDHVCGFDVRDQVPATWLHVLTFPLQAWLMSQPAFPFRLAGLIHVSNEMTLRRPVSVSERLDLQVRAGEARPHRRGTVFDLVGEVSVAGEQVWTGTSTYLSRASGLQGDPAATLRLAAPTAPTSQVWRLGADLGRRYAAVSGDANPIHLSPVTARLFGQPRAIIHGMWTHARALAAFGGRLPDAYHVQVQFARAILLPGTVVFQATADSDGRRFAVVSPRDGKPHLVGQLTAPA